MIDKKNLLVRLEDAAAVEDRRSMANLLKEATEAIRFRGLPMRVIDADLMIRWTERDTNGDEIECCGTVEDLLSGVRTMDGKKIVVEEIEKEATL